MLIDATSLDAFVAEADRLGGPGSVATEAYWKEFRYQPSVVVDETLDPDGDAYFAAMMALYGELSGRRFEPEKTEFTSVNVESLIKLESPYSFASSAHRAMHYLRLANAHQLAGANGGNALDMGCGWGLSSEFLAQLGYSVTAVDINPSFIELVRGRASRLGLDIKTQLSPFENVSGTPESFDVALFYECFHHAARPRDVLRAVSRLLKSEGVLVLAGEPVQSIWWRHWGLRLDPLSVYCIRKYGWFESGWSAEYLTSLVSGVGLIPVIYENADPTIGTTLVGFKTQTLDHRLLQRVAKLEDWWLEGVMLLSNRSGRSSALRLPCSPPVRLAFVLNNYGLAPIDVVVRAAGSCNEYRLARGSNEVVVFPGRSTTEFCDVEFEAASWCPDEVLGNGDLRRLGFHLERMTIG